MTILRPILRPVVSPLLRHPLDPSYGSLEAATRAMFGASKGVMYDLTRASTLYQDSARTTLVSANGDPIGSVTDLSPNLKHASQATAGSRPLWNSGGYAALDGTDDSWATAAIDFTGTDAVTVVVAVRKGSDANIAMLVELSANAGTATPTAGSFFIAAPNDAGVGNVSFRSNGTTGGPAIKAALAAPVVLVLTGRGDISTDTCALRVNGADAASDATDQGTGNYGNHVLNIGRRNNSVLPFNGRIYRLLVIGRTLTAAELTIAEAWANQPVRAF